MRLETKTKPQPSFSGNRKNNMGPPCLRYQKNNHCPRTTCTKTMIYVVRLYITVITLTKIKGITKTLSYNKILDDKITICNSALRLQNNNDSEPRLKLKVTFVP